MDPGEFGGVGLQIAAEAALLEGEIAKVLFVSTTDEDFESDRIAAPRVLWLASARQWLQIRKRTNPSINGSGTRSAEEAPEKPTQGGQRRSAGREAGCKRRRAPRRPKYEKPKFVDTSTASFVSYICPPAKEDLLMTGNFAVKSFAVCLLLASVLKAEDNMDRHRALNQKGKTIDTDPNGPSDVYEAVFKVDHLLGSMPSLAVASLKPSVVSAETLYWQGRSRGVSETDIVNAVNEVATTLHLPDYAKISENEVRVARLRMLSDSPGFIGKRFGIKDPSTGKLKVSAVMSPLQAIHMTQTLMDLKMTREEFQVTPEEWETTHAHQPPSGPSHVEYRVASTSKKAAAIQAAFNDGLAKLSDQQGFALLAQMVRRYGI